MFAGMDDASGRGMTRKPVLVRIAALLGLGVMAACGGSVSPGSSQPDSGHAKDGGVEPDASNSSDSGKADTGQHDSGGGAVPLDHRPDDSLCLQPASPGSCSASVGIGQCSKDSDCTSGNAGRCQNSAGGPAGCYCEYDTCASDSSCPSGQLCVCHGSAYAEGAGNTCMPGNCRVDSDCGADGYCSPAHGTTGCGGVGGYYCHTSADECVNDSDCTGQGLDVCTWSSSANRWECQMEQLCA